MKKLNIKEGLNFINSFNVSLYKTKIILLNNFYYLFYPTKISNNNYGITKNTDGYLIVDPEALLSGSNIYDLYPFREKIIGLNNCYKFFTFTHNNYDLYNKKELLEVGCSYKQNKYMKKSLNIIKNFIMEYNNIDIFNLNLIEIIKDFYKDCLTIENLNNIKNKINYLRKKELSKEEKKVLKNFFYDLYQFNLRESSRSIIKVLNNKISNENKEIGLLKSKMYFVKSSLIESIIKKILSERNLKVELSKEFDNLKNKYTKILNQKIKNNNL